MSKLLKSSITRTIVVDKIRTTGFRINYDDNPISISIEYLTILSGGEPYLRGHIIIDNNKQIEKLYKDVAKYISDGDAFDIALDKTLSSIVENDVLIRLL